MRKEYADIAVVVYVLLMLVGGIYLYFHIEYIANSPCEICEQQYGQMCFYPYGNVIIGNSDFLNITTEYIEIKEKISAS